MQEFPLEVSPLEISRKLRAGEPLRLIDVRDPAEHSMCSIPGAELIPMRLIPQAAPALRENAGEGCLVFYCHNGARSLQVVRWLRQRGLHGCQSMEGGIDRWSMQVDPGVPRY